MDFCKRFDETELPTTDMFYSKLNDTHITDEDYHQAKEVMTTFDCKKIGDYHDLYNQTDVLLLADGFETYRTTCIDVYKLDPALYYSNPGLGQTPRETEKRVNVN